MQSVGVPFILQFQHLAPDDDQAKPFQPGWTWMKLCSLPSAQQIARKPSLPLDWRFSPPASSVLSQAVVYPIFRKRERRSREATALTTGEKGKFWRAREHSKDPPGRWDQVADLPSDCGSLPNPSSSDHLAVAFLSSSCPLMVSSTFTFLFCFFSSLLSVIPSLLADIIWPWGILSSFAE